jgi:RimJ/RimL family protein N-acetyltransferase
VLTQIVRFPHAVPRSSRSPEATAGGVCTGSRDNGPVVLIKCPAGREQIMMGTAMSVAEPDRVVAERVELRQVPAGHARVLADPEADDPGSRSYARGYPLPGTRAAAQNFVRQAGDGGNGQWGIFEIILRETGEVIGDIGFHGPPDEAGTVEIGYGIVEQYRGRGLAGESAVAFCRLAWSRPGVTRIIAQAEEGNAASAGVLRHAGFREDGVADGLRNFSLDRP